MKLIVTYGLSLAVLGFAVSAGAQEADPGGRGIVGGALLGAELVLITEAVVGVEPAWAYVGGGVAGAAVGGYAGSLVEDRAERDVSLALLAVGVVGIIPTVVWVGNATQPRAPESVRLLPPRIDVKLDRYGPTLSFDVVRAAF